jgi:hypothetical protein
MRRDIVSFHLKAEFDRFTVITAHYQDYPIGVANTGTGEKTDRLTDEIPIRVRIYDVAAWMRT